MLKLDGISKYFLYFIGVYVLLVVFSSWAPIRQAHNVYYCRIGKAFFNLVNKNYYTDWKPEAPANDSDWDATIKLYSVAKHGDRLSNERYLKSIQPQQLVYNNFYSIAFLPLLFLIALYIVTPGMVWYEKLWRFVISLIILNIFLAYHVSHMIENVIMYQGGMGPDFWNKFIALMGFYGLREAMYVVAALSWILLVAGKLWQTKSN